MIVRGVPRGGNVVAIALAFEGGLAALAFLVGGVTGTPPLQNVRPTWGAVGLGLLATVPTLVALWWSVTTSWAPMRRLLAEVDRIAVPIFAPCSPLQLVAIALAAGVGEEVFFRGVVQVALTNRLHPMIGLIAASALFGAFHLVTPLYAILAGVVGIYLGALLLVFDNLLIPIVVHALYDVVALVFLVNPARHAPPAPGGDRMAGPDD